MRDKPPGPHNDTSLCRTHPAYRGEQPPKGKCRPCWWVWQAKIAGRLR